MTSGLFMKYSNVRCTTKPHCLMTCQKNANNLLNSIDLASAQFQLINLFKHDRFLKTIKKSRKNGSSVQNSVSRLTEKRSIAKNVQLSIKKSTRQFVEFIWRRPQIVFVEIRTNCRSRFFELVDTGNCLTTISFSK